MAESRFIPGVVNDMIYRVISEHEGKSQQELADSLTTMTLKMYEPMVHPSQLASAESENEELHGYLQDANGIVTAVEVLSRRTTDKNPELLKLINDICFQYLHEYEEPSYSEDDKCQNTWHWAIKRGGNTCPQCSRTREQIKYDEDEEMRTIGLL